MREAGVHLERISKHFTGNLLIFQTMPRCICLKLGFFEDPAHSRTAETNILGAAHAHGRENLPAPDDTTPTPIEQQVIERFEHGIAALREYTERRLQRIAAEFQKYDLTASDLNVNGASEEAIHEMALLRGTTKDKLLESRLVERDRFRELSYFKAENHLVRSALYPQSRLLAVSLLLAIIVGEAVLNARLFATADALGLLGGWLQALIVSVLNVLPSFLVGIVALRNLHHRRIGRRCAAFVGVLVFVTVIGGYNLLVAHFRAAVAIDPDNAAALAIPHLVANPWDMTATIEAVYLFALGLFAAACALLDGYCLADDRYPGYGTIDRRYRAALSTYRKTKQAFRRDIERIVKKAYPAINRRLKKLQRKVEVGIRVINAGALTLREAEACAAQGAHASLRLLSTYREANKRVRTIPPPTYFATYPVLDTTITPVPFDLEQKKQGLREALAAKIGEASRAQSWLRECAEREIAALERCADEIEITTASPRPRPAPSDYLLAYKQ